MTTTRLPFFSEHVTGSVGARLFMLAYRLTQVVHMASVVSADRDQDKKVKLLKALREIASDLYFEVAALDPVLPADVGRIDAPDVATSKDPETRIRLVGEAYAQYRKQGGLE
ncbi:MAG: hypothetical protein A3J29_23085 [Acidobacteria bacterium RIFCSPLOWO2_12_FULL_67_14b]|nr:MAG: hypothetical protein A3I61_13510 [Acidobacteria bacterium RIFCSPLOWO2_02_FULL_68_18]OFW45394.1 MAG: hypothetical protein A3J29_23085 [Acidobacteria bacterium RIFCSPLOWO2_12_FULL_67_14b]